MDFLNVYFVFCLAHLIAEDLDLTDSSVNEAVVPWAEIIRVDLKIQRKTFDPLLRGEVRAQRIDADVHL